MDGKDTRYLINALDSWEEDSLLSNMLSYVPEIAKQIIKNKSQSVNNSPCQSNPEKDLTNEVYSKDSSRSNLNHHSEKRSLGKSRQGRLNRT